MTSTVQTRQHSWRAPAKGPGPRFLSPTGLPAAGRTGPQPKHVALPVDADNRREVLQARVYTHRHIDRPVAYLPVTDLQNDGMCQHNRVTRIEGTGLPLLHVLDYRVGHPRDQIPRHFGALDVGQVVSDVAGGHSLRLQTQHGVVETGQPTGVLGHHRRGEGARPVAGHTDADLADVGARRLRARPVTDVARPGPATVPAWLPRLRRRPQFGAQAQTTDTGAPPEPRAPLPEPRDLELSQDQALRPR